MYEREDYDRNEKLAEAERSRWKDENLAGMTVIEESLAATMAALDAPLKTGESPSTGQGRRRTSGRSSLPRREKSNGGRGVHASDDFEDGASYAGELEPKMTTRIYLGRQPCTCVSYQ